MVQVAQSQAGGIELPILLTVIHHPVDKRVQTGLIRRAFSTSARLCAVSEHENGRFTRLRAWAGIAEQVDVHFGCVTTRRFDCPIVLVTRGKGAMMLADEILYS
jgi:hypothetical protein